ncbi:MAG: tryptophan synthase subunit alpha [Pseudomonadales bacterium]|nr:tryptophan synthase subunit alpha [Pseudomonadales bacterium]
MSRIQTTFEQLKAGNKKALIPYVTVGDPSIESTLLIMHALAEAGCDVIELGVPFSDPSADGPVIQAASERALKNNTSLRDVLAVVSRFRESNQTVPIVLMGYLNPFEVYGYQDFVRDASVAGIDGVLIVDMPPEESEPFSGLLKENDIDLIYLIAPTTTEKRAQMICAQASGYIYYVSLKGVTGAGNLDISEVASKVNGLRNITKLPVGVGFGIKDAESAKSVGAVSDGVVIGSALVNLIYQTSQNSDKPEDIRRAIFEYMGTIREALNSLVEE